MKPALETPVAFLIFNRPETTRRVFAEIRRARPRQLLVVADGPRPGRQGEAEACAAARAVINEVDWLCEVKTSYSEANLGCKRRVSSGLDWVFQCVEEAIILEDDCVPHPTFFPYCAELLARYRDDERVMHIGGANFTFGRSPRQASYYFSRYAHVWGWASWRRAWRHYDVAMARWPTAHNQVLDQFEHPTERRFWRAILERVYRGQVDTWDYQWAFACFVQGGLGVVPVENLVTNVGFGSQATHTVSESVVANMPAAALPTPLVHPTAMVREPAADSLVSEVFFRPKSGLRQLLELLRGYGRRLREVGARR